MPFSWNPPTPFRSLLAAAPLLLASSLGLPAQAGQGAAEQIADAQTALHQTRVVKRQNLQPVNYAPSDTARGQIRVGIRNPGQNTNDIVVHRSTQQAHLAPLTDLASLRAEVAFV